MRDEQEQTLSPRFGSPIHSAESIESAEFARRLRNLQHQAGLDGIDAELVLRSPQPMQVRKIPSIEMVTPAYYRSLKTQAGAPDLTKSRQIPAVVSSPHPPEADYMAMALRRQRMAGLNPLRPLQIQAARKAPTVWREEIPLVSAKVDRYGRHISTPRARLVKKEDPDDNDSVNTVRAAEMAAHSMEGSASPQDGIGLLTKVLGIFS